MIFENDLLENVSWSFGEGDFHDLDSFVKKLVEYNKYLDKEVDPEMVVLHSSKVIIRYLLVIDEPGENDPVNQLETDSDERQLDLVIDSSNSEYFTCAELLFKIHNEIADQLKNTDYKFFEGLELVDNYEVQENCPVYFMNIGS